MKRSILDIASFLVGGGVLLVLSWYVMQTTGAEECVPGGDHYERLFVSHSAQSFLTPEKFELIFKGVTRGDGKTCYGRMPITFEHYVLLVQSGVHVEADKEGK